MSWGGEAKAENAARAAAAARTRFIKVSLGKGAQHPSNKKTPNTPANPNRTLLHSEPLAYNMKPMKSAIRASVTALLVMVLLRWQAAPMTIPYQLTHSLNMDPSPNPDGKRLVYISVTAGKEQLFVMNPDGSHSVQITHDDANYEDPVHGRRDGRKIAYR